MTATATQAPIGEVMAVRPGDTAASQVDGWLQDYAASRDPLLRERIILAYLDLADRLADRYRTSRGTTPEDLRQTARAGLIAAIGRYDPNYGSPFVAYAVACVIGELKRHLRDTSWRLHVPRPLKEHSMRVCKTADQLQQTLGRSPTIAELAQRLGVDEEEVLEASAVAQSRQELSLDRPIGDDTARCLSDLVAAPRPPEEPEDLLAPPSADRGAARARPQGDRLAVLPRPWPGRDRRGHRLLPDAGVAAAAPCPGQSARPTPGLLSSLIQEQTSRSTILGPSGERPVTHLARVRGLEPLTRRLAADMATSAHPESA